MNRLQSFLSNVSVDEVKAMNALQENGVISDNCVHASDVPDCDAIAAIKWVSDAKRERRL